MITYKDSKWKTLTQVVDKAYSYTGANWSTHNLSGDTIHVGDAAGSHVNGLIVTAGGISECSYPTAEARVIDTSFQNTRICPLPYRLFGHGMTNTPDGQIIAGGGVRVSSDGALELSSDILLYCPKSDRWEAIARLPWRAARLVVEQVNNKVYFIAGDTATNAQAERPFAPAICRDTVQVLDLKTGSWKEGTPKPTPETGVTSAVNGDSIYVVSSVMPDGTISDIVEVYNVSNDSWSHIPPMPTARTSVPCAFIGSKLYCINGLGKGLIPLSLVEAYDTETGEWTTEISAPEASYASVLVKTNDLNFTLFGGLK